MRVRQSTTTGGPVWWRDGDAWIKIYLIASVTLVVGVGLAVAFWPNAIEAGVEHFDDRWTRRLEFGDELIKSRQYERAVDYFGDLDRHFPAQSVKHKRDKERERLLANLALALEKSGRRNRAVNVLKRLVDFDPKNITNHYLLGCALRRSGDGDDARESFENILAINPSHVAATRKLVELDFEAGRFSDVVTTWRRHLDAVHFTGISLSADEKVVDVDVLADGQPHEIRVPLNLDGGYSGELRLQVQQNENDIDEVRIFADRLWVESPERFGHVEQTDRRSEIAISGAVEASEALTLAIPELELGVSFVHLVLRIPRAVDASTWDMVERSYRNTLAFDELEAMQPRVLIQ